MNTLRENLRHLIENSEALKAAPDEQWYWLSALAELNEKGIERLTKILAQESGSVETIRSEEARHLAQIDTDHLKALGNFKHSELPRFVKKWEAAASAKENPDALLDSLNDGH